MAGRWIVLPLDPLQRGIGRPSVQGAIHGEALIAEQRLDLRCTHQLIQEPGHHLLIEQSLTVFGELPLMPGRIIKADTYESSKQQVVGELLHQYAL